MGEEDIDEAIRLLSQCKSSLEDDADKYDPKAETDDIVSKIFRKISEMLNVVEQGGFVRFDEVEKKVLRLGYTRDHLNRCLEEYSREDMAVLYVNDQRTKIRMA